MKLPARLPERAKSKAIGAMHHFAFAATAALTALALGDHEGARQCAREARRYWFLACTREFIEGRIIEAARWATKKVEASRG